MNRLLKTHKLTPYKAKLINHVILVEDASGSMSHLRQKLIQVTNAQLETFRQEGKRLGQETRISLYTFNTTCRNHLFDVPIDNVHDISQHYATGGSTALIDAVYSAINETLSIAQGKDDHAFLLIALTDGEENASRNATIGTLNNRIKGLPENYTVSVLVPDVRGVNLARQYGFPADNISIWEATEAGLDEVERTVSASTTSYYAGRSVGRRGTKTFFAPAVGNLSRHAVQTQLDELQPSQYQLFPIFRKQAIKEFVEKRTGKPYRIGSVYYSFTKPEKVQKYKQLIAQEVSTGRVYTGQNVRSILGLPTYEVMVNPVSHPKYDLFLQSTSVNRNLLPGTQVIILN